VPRDTERRALSRDRFPLLHETTVSLIAVLLGRRLANQEVEGRKIGALEGVPAMGLDGLGSAAYGPEAMLTVLVVVGSAGLGAVQPITWAILVLLAILFFSYWQTIAAYPSNGGSYTVARNNLGARAGLLAAAALMVDYMLNVAVGISAGVGALTSAMPALHAYTLPLCLSILTAITVVNLRGTKESGIALAVPTYLFIACLSFILTLGIWKVWTKDGNPQPVIPLPGAHGSPSETMTLWLLLRAFAAGCTAMTGVEAVSNGVSAFKDPTVTYAHRTLAAIVVVLGLLLFSIAYLARSYGVMAMDQTKEGYQSVLSQLAAAIWGHGWLYCPKRSRFPGAGSSTPWAWCFWLRALVDYSCCLGALPTGSFPCSLSAPSCPSRCPRRAWLCIGGDRERAPRSGCGSESMA
jgi:amino acid transporter